MLKTNFTAFFSIILKLLFNKINEKLVNGRPNEEIKRLLTFSMSHRLIRAEYILLAPTKLLTSNKIHLFRHYSFIFFIRNIISLLKLWHLATLYKDLELGFSIYILLIKLLVV